jgi:D-alanyl-D-alanine carboxypeptidase
MRLACDLQLKPFTSALRLAMVTFACAVTALLWPAGSAARGLPRVAAVAHQLAHGVATSAIVFVSNRGHTSVATAGQPHRTANQRFRIGSVTKTFTAALVMQLVDEHRLRLDDSLARYLPGVVPEGSKITIRDLLQHESGLANFTDYLPWLDNADRSRTSRPIDTLRFAASKPLLFQPGTQWSYSNTNYIALGLIIEKVTGDSYRRELTQRILRPLELTATELPTTRTLRDLHDPGTNPLLAWAAGAIVSNANDLSRFYGALLSGRVVSKTAIAQMEQTVPANTVFRIWQGDGLGILSAHIPCGPFWGHDGWILDYFTIVEASPRGRVAIISVTSDNLEFPHPNMATLLCS